MNEDKEKEYINTIEKLETEIKNLKTSFESDLTMWGQEWTSVKDQLNDSLKENERYENTLKEIEKIINNGRIQRIIDENDNCVTVETVNKIDYKRILNLINDARRYE